MAAVPDAGIPFGSYLLLKRLARGGMAEVFLARESGPGGFERKVALKRILPHLVDTPDFVRMFLDEARLAGRLTHPNIVHIYEFGQVDEHYFIAMEFVDGVHAGTLIERGAYEKMPAALVARIGADACAGLNYAHNIKGNDNLPLQLVHRDVSPPNLMISQDGVVKLVDFGIAKAVSTVEKTQPGIVKGKFAYMSPEQTMGMKLDGKSDVFSLTLVLWELLAGRVAVDRADPVAAMTAIRDGQLPSIRDARPDIAPKLAAALEAALAVEPEDRLSAAELGNAFEGYIKSSPELGTSMQLSEWIRQRFGRPDEDHDDDIPGPTLHDGDVDFAPADSQRATVTSGRGLAKRLDSEDDRPTRAMPPASITDENTTIESSDSYVTDLDDEAPTEIAPADADSMLDDVGPPPSRPPPGRPQPRPGDKPVQGARTLYGPGAPVRPSPGGASRPSPRRPGQPSPNAGRPSPNAGRPSPNAGRPSPSAGRPSPNAGARPSPNAGSRPSPKGPPVQPGSKPNGAGAHSGSAKPSTPVPPNTIPPSAGVSPVGSPPGGAAALSPGSGRGPAPASQPPPMGMSPSSGRRPAPASQPPPMGMSPSSGRRPAPASQPPPMGGSPNMFAGQSNMNMAQYSGGQMYRAPYPTFDANKRLWIGAIIAFVLAALIALALLLDDETPDPGAAGDDGGSGAEIIGDPETSGE